MNTASSAHFDRQYQSHLKHIKLKGLQPKTIKAYSRAIRCIGERFEGRIDDLEVFGDVKYSGTHHGFRS